MPPTAPGKNATLYMLQHNEFHGFEHAPELCNSTAMVKGRCWYNSVGLSVSHDGGRNIRHIAPARLATNPRLGLHGAHS